ncbi:FecCD family ABC transporter permease [Pseudoclavibacter caeni]|uniref:FecCD family ABC transporter permease n=1 Tax=Pseudoclavibacter caeni TaxID=908846 RepID=UPI00178D5C2E|nr:iron chelate uptake ABC transporter family permease subunit [Pseudoclavibacter caeni]NYJ96728.1 iron complex transport system permease protein [Pseudoclavibacter caeni]
MSTTDTVQGARSVASAGGRPASGGSLSPVATPTPEQAARLRDSLRRAHVHRRLGPLRVRHERRGAVVHALLVAGILVLGTVSLLIGDYDISVADAFGAIFGTQTFDDPLVPYFVDQVRLPRVVGGILVGAALGTSGAIFQVLSGNPLGSPDIIGFTRGSATGAIIAIIVFGGSTPVVAAGAIVGGLVTAAVVYGLAWRGGVSGYRLVLVGIGVGAVLAAVNSLLIVKADLAAAQKASQWMAGSLNATLWPQCAAVALAIAVLLPAAAGQFRAMTLMPLGDPLAIGLGVRVERSRLLMVVIGVALMAVAVAAAGPIAFVALAAPHLMRRITRTSGIGLFGAGLMGAFLVLVSDLIARRVIAPNELAVGVVTGSLGGIYLIILLGMEWRRRP